VVVHLHGAGWVFGNHHTHDRLIRELAVGAQAAVVFPNYSRSPEAKYPTAIQECDAVATWVAEHGQKRGLDPSRIAIAGDSVGGNISAAVTLLAKQRGGPGFRQQVLFYPVTDANFDTESCDHSPPATTCAATACSGTGTSTPATQPSGPSPPPPRCAPASSSSPAYRPP
jgi:acetyl esterase